MRRSGFTLTEVLVVIGLVCVLGSLAVTYLPRVSQSADADRHPGQLTAALEAAAAQAKADGGAVTVTGLGDTLVWQGPQGEERLTFPGATLAGRVSVTAQGGSGVISLSGPGLPCTQAWVGGYGTANSAPCGAGTEPVTTAAPTSPSGGATEPVHGGVPGPVVSDPGPGITPPEDFR